MATIYWEGDTSTDSTVGSNWSGGSTPGTTDDVIFDGTASGGCTLQGNLSVKSVSMTSAWAYTLDFNGYDMIANNGAITLDGDDAGTDLNFSSAGTTIQVLGDFDLTINQSSASSDNTNCTVDLQGTGSLIMNSNDFDPYAVICCYSGKTTTLDGTNSFDTRSWVSYGGDLVLDTGITIHRRTADSFTFSVGEITGTENLTFSFEEDVDQSFNAFNGPSWTGQLEFANFSSGNRMSLNGTNIVGGNVKFFSNSGTMVINGGDLECEDLILEAGQFDSVRPNWYGNTYVINGDFYIVDNVGNYQISWGSSVWEFYGNVSFDPGSGSHSSWDRDTSTWYFKGNTNQTFLPETSLTCPNIIVDKTGGVLEIDNTMTCDRFQNDSDTVEIKAAEKLTVSSYQSGDINGSTWRSDTASSQAEVDFGSSVIVLSTTWTDINNVNATAIDATDSSNTDGGGNTNIDFPPPQTVFPLFWPIWWG